MAGAQRLAAVVAPQHARVLGGGLPGQQRKPANADHPANLLAAEIADEFLDDPPKDPVANNVLAPESYARILDNLGCTDQHVRLQVYGHYLDSTADTVDWLAGTTLTRVKARMAPSDRVHYRGAVRRRVIEVLGDRRPYFFPFKRILIWGRVP